MFSVISFKLITFFRDAIRYDVRQLQNHIILTGPASFLSYDSRNFIILCIFM